MFSSDNSSEPEQGTQDDFGLYPAHLLLEFNTRNLIIHPLLWTTEDNSSKMSLMFKPPAKDRNLDPNLVRTMLDENALLIKIVTEYQNKGKIYECMKYQDILTRNLLYLSGKSQFQADESFSIQRSKEGNI